MKYLIDRNNQYSINLKFSVILSLVLVICLFNFFPKPTPSLKVNYNEPIIFIDDIPITVQLNKEILIKPSIPEIKILDELYESELLEDVSINENNVITQSKGIENHVVNAFVKTDYSSPRQILEVLPEKDKNISGSIKLKLKINEAGKVTEHIIIYNYLDCENCLSEIITAAYKSKWKPGKRNKINSDYWVEKTYSFY